MRFWIFTAVLLSLSHSAWAACDKPDGAGVEGEIIYNSAWKVMQFCNGTDWIAMAGNGESTPSGAVMAFDLPNCPLGWSEYAASSGRFLRGRCITGQTCNDSGGQRVAGNTQEDSIKQHKHALPFFSNPGGNPTQHNAVFGQDTRRADTLGANFEDGQTNVIEGEELAYLSDFNIAATSETRPKNVAVLYCRKN